MKLLDNLISKCNTDYSRKYYIDTLKEKLASVSDEESKNDARRYIEDLFETTNDVSTGETFKQWDRKFKDKLYKIIEENYKTCS